MPFARSAGQLVRIALLTGICATTAAAQIGVTVTVSATKAGSTATVAGSSKHFITDAERAAFGITDAPLKKAIGRSYGKNPNDAYLTGTSDWGDLYKTYGWVQTSTLIPTPSITIASVDTTTATLYSGDVLFDDRGSTGSSLTISASVTESLTTKWKGPALGIGMLQPVRWSVTLGAVPGATQLIALGDAWQKDTTWTRTTAVSSGAGLSDVKSTARSVTLRMRALKTTTTLQVAFAPTLQGVTAIYYNPTYNGRHFWSLDIIKVMTDAGLPTKLANSESATIVSYSNFIVDAVDGRGTTLKSAAIKAP